MNFDHLVTVIRRLALEAGDRIMEVYNGPDFEVKAKGDSSPVTEADEAADALISAGLRAAFPEVTLITEEQAASHALTASTFLIVDPLDGTKEFISRNGDFTVNIGLVENGVPVLGIVYAPARGALYAGRLGRGAEQLAIAGGTIAARHIFSCETMTLVIFRRGIHPSPD